MTLTTTAAAERPGKSIASLLGPPPDAPGPAVRLSESALWNHQRRFYEDGVAGIWGTATVPHGITGNPRIANTYARLAVRFLHSVPVTDEVLHVVELGGGSGRFAYLFVRQLQQLAPGLRFRYVVTDFSADRVAAWSAHPSYQPLVEAGLLDFAVLDADRLGSMELTVSGRTIGPGSLRGPVVGIANYVFDTLRHDAYAVRAGELLESRVAVPTRRDEAVLSGIEWDTGPCGPLPEPLAPVLEHYRETLDDTAVLVPVGGLACLDFLAGLTSGPSCVLVADKGHASLLELCSNAEPAVVPHGAGFSLMVNFDCLARCVRERGGLAVLPREPARSLVVAAFVRGEVTESDRFAAEVQDELLDLGPDNYFTIRPLLGREAPPAVETLLASLRLSRFDPAMFIELLPGLLEVLPTVPDGTRNEVGRVLVQVWDNFFPIGEPVDLGLCVGLAFSAMERYPEAIEFLDLSVKEQPESAAAAFAMAVARRGLRDLGAAAEWTARALELQPGFSEARALRAILAEELAGAGR
jgi:hypothetical protein